MQNRRVLDHYLSRPDLPRGLEIVGVEIGLIVALFILLGLVVRIIFRRIENSPSLAKHQAIAKTIRRNVSMVLALVATALVLGVIALNGVFHAALTENHRVQRCRASAYPLQCIILRGESEANGLEE